jgi:hypothetical protein
MTQKIWLGAIYLKDEGGYEIILKSLKHYRERLRTINSSPELKNAAVMFASVLNQQAVKTIPEIDKVIQKIQTNLTDIKLVNALIEDIPFLEKALLCYQSDIDKAENTGHMYFVKIIGDMQEARKDKEIIKKALKKIKQYS